jgi:hypothetical protein
MERLRSPADRTGAIVTGRDEPRNRVLRSARSGSRSAEHRGGDELVERGLARRHHARGCGHGSHPVEGVADRVAGQQRPVCGSDRVGVQVGDRVDVPSSWSSRSPWALDGYRRPQKVQLYEQLRTAIVEGRLAPGDRLVPSRIMAADLHISRATVTEAYGRLSAEGYIEGRSGGGSVVSAAPLQVRRRSGVAALEPTQRAAGITPYDRDPTAEALFDFRPGRLDLALFPVAAWRRCVLRTLNAPPGSTTTPAGRRSSARPSRTGLPDPAASQRRRTTRSSPPEPGTPSTWSPAS